MLNKKGIGVIMTILIVGAIILIGVVVVVSPLPQILGIGTAGLCSETPFDKDCFCPNDFNKLSFGWLGGVGTKYFCEKVVLFLNPTDSDFESKAIQIAKDDLTISSPNCDTISCSSDIGIASARVLQETDGNRNALVECIGEQKVWWNARIDLESGVVWSSECFSFEQPEGNLDLTKEEFKSKCEDTSNQYCKRVVSSSLSKCSTQEIFPAEACASGEECTKGVAYSYELVDADWLGCGHFGTKSRE